MPRMMCMPNFSPFACTQSASCLKPVFLPSWTDDGKRAGTGMNRPLSSSSYLSSSGLGRSSGLTMYQPSSMTAYEYPDGFNFVAKTSALSRNCCSLMRKPYESQLFHPIGGVDAITFLFVERVSWPAIMPQKHRRQPAIRIALIHSMARKCLLDFTSPPPHGAFFGALRKTKSEEFRFLIPLTLSISVYANLR